MSFLGFSSADAIRRAERLLARAQLADGHNDLPWALRERLGPGAVDEMTPGWAERLDVTALPGLQTDLVRLRRGRVGLQFWSVYVPCRFRGPAAVLAVLQQVDLARAMIARHPDELRPARTAEEARAAFTAGRIASLLGAEGGHCLDGSLAVLRALHRLDVRYLTLTHNENTTWADAATDRPEHGGLTAFGRTVVGELNRLGMLVDLSHTADTTMRDALAVTRAPVVFSHSSCRTIADHPRNVPDDVLGQLPTNGGVCMITFVPRFVSPACVEWDAELTAALTAAGGDPRDLSARERFAQRWSVDHPPPTATLDDVVAHLDHAREVAGIEHVGLGGDYDGTPRQPTGLADVSCYPALFGALLERGWSEADCARLAGENVLRVLHDAAGVADAGQDPDGPAW